MEFRLPESGRRLVKIGRSWRLITPESAAQARVTWRFRDLDVRTALEAVARIPRANFVLPPHVRGNTTMSLKDVPWRDVLDSMARAAGFQVDVLPSGILCVLHPSVRKDMDAPAPAAADAKRVSLQVRSADLREVLRDLSLQAGLSMVVSPAVRGEATATLYDVPWPDALEAIVSSLGYAVATESSGIQRVVPPADAPVGQELEAKVRERAPGK